MCKKDKTQVKQTYEVFSYTISYNNWIKIVIFILIMICKMTTTWQNLIQDLIGEEKNLFKKCKKNIHDK